jgi:hypothetical protein
MSAAAGPLDMTRDALRQMVSARMDAVERQQAEIDAALAPSGDDDAAVARWTTPAAASPAAASPAAASPAAAPCDEPDAVALLHRLMERLHAVECATDRLQARVARTDLPEDSARPHASDAPPADTAIGLLTHSVGAGAMNDFTDLHHPRALLRAPWLHGVSWGVLAADCARRDDEVEWTLRFTCDAVADLELVLRDPGHEGLGALVARVETLVGGCRVDAWQGDVAVVADTATALFGRRVGARDGLLFLPLVLAPFNGTTLHALVGTTKSPTVVSVRFAPGRAAGSRAAPYGRVHSARAKRASTSAPGRPQRRSAASAHSRLGASARRRACWRPPPSWPASCRACRAAAARWPPRSGCSRAR